MLKQQLVTLSKQGGGLFSRMSNRGTSKGSTNQVSAKSQDSSRRSVTTDGSSSGGEDRGPVDLDVIDKQMAEEELIRFFEEGGGENKVDPVGIAGPIDLDLLDDDIHHYDTSIDDVERDEDINLLVEQAEDFAICNNRTVPKTIDVADKEMAAESRGDEISDCQSVATEKVINDWERQKSAPVDMDDVHDLETTFDFILDQHEDNFMVWTANRKSVNAILNAEEQATTRAMNRKYGHSIRRERNTRWSS